MKGLGTNESTLTEIIGTRNNYEISEIKKVFKELYGKELIKWVESETSGRYRKLLISLLQANRRENPVADPNACKVDADNLYKAGAARWGTDEAIFNKIFALRSPEEIRLIAQIYQNSAGKPLEKAIKDEFSGDIKDLLRTIVRNFVNPHEYFATRIHEAVHGLGTDDVKLIRVVISRLEIDMPQIKMEYQRLFGKDMISAIRSDTSGDYRNLLVGILTQNIR